MNDKVKPSLSIVIPVYQGEVTLESVVLEIIDFATEIKSRKNGSFIISEIILVDDCGPDNSSSIIERLDNTFGLVSPVWLSRNFGQHAATLAGMASSRGDWIVTLDEDGQHNPKDIESLFDAAQATRSDVVYSKPTNPAPHGVFRNWSSRAAKITLSKIAKVGDPTSFQSFRLIRGNIGRSVSAYVGPEVYLDVALSWVTTRISTAPVTLRQEGDRKSGYSLSRLFGLFWRMVLTSGTRGLRAVSILGVLFATGGVLGGLFILIQRFATNEIPAGWSSLIVLSLFSTGAILLSLGIIAEYIGVIVGTAMGKPPYLINDKNQGFLDSPKNY